MSSQCPLPPGFESNHDERQTTIQIAQGLKHLIEHGQYDSPMFGRSSEKLVGLIKRLEAATPADLAQPEWHCMNVDYLESAVEEQDQVIAEAEAEAEEWTTGKFRGHDDAWIPVANVERAKLGRVIIRWLISMRQHVWMCSKVPPEIVHALKSGRK